MDLGEWELLPNSVSLVEDHDEGSKRIFYSKYASQFVDSAVPNQIVPLPIQVEQSVQKSHQEEVVDEVTKEVVMVEDDQVSQVFFKKMEETEYENMILRSPKTCVSPIDEGSLSFDDKDEILKVDNESCVIKKKDVEEKNGGVNFWSWSLSTGIGAICSFGVVAAAATVCIFMGNHQKQKQHKQNQKIGLQVSDDKKMKQVVHQPAQLFESISGAREAPITRKAITVEGLLLSTLEHIQESLSIFESWNQSLALTSC